MDVILLKDVDRLGRAGQKVSVKGGYARNFLLPKGWAAPATRGGAASAEALQAARARSGASAKAKAAELAERLEKLSCAIRVSVGEQGKLHGAVTAGAICEALEKEGISLEKQQVQLDRPIAQLGEHRVSIRLHPEVKAAVTVVLTPGP